MLLELYVENFILIDKMTIPFEEGLNIMTGETGAGKSIVLNAINLVLGGQASKDLIKSGKDKAIVSGTFQIFTDDVKALLEEKGLSSEDDILSISRELQISGKSTTRINGRIQPVSLLKQLGNALVDIHGQHEHQSLLKISNHLSIIDQLDRSIDPLKKQMKQSVGNIHTLADEINKLMMDPEEKNRKLDLLNYQIEEIETANLKDGEDEEVETRLKLLSKFSDIMNTMDQFQSLLNDGNLLSDLNAVMGQIQSFVDLDGRLASIHKSIGDAFYTLEDVNREASDYLSDMDLDEEEQHFLIKRLDTINDLKRKFGHSVYEINNYLNKLFSELEAIEKLDETISSLKNRKEKEVLSYSKDAQMLSILREQVRLSFINDINNELKSLNMEQASFDIAVDVEDRIHQNGYDQMEFLIATNAGEPFRSLKKVVSGGELSRLMLSIKVIIGKIDSIPTMVFDEVDAGISGQTATIVGEKLKAISENAQVICVTHLANIAVYADHHLHIHKTTDNNNTFTTITTIKGDEVITEISRLISGDNMTDISRSNAIEMLKLANKNTR